MLRKMMMILAMAAAFNAVLTVNGFAFSGGVPHDVTHPIMSGDLVTAMPTNTATAIRLRHGGSMHSRHPGR